MKRLLIFLILLQSILSAQQTGDLTGYEYWFNNNTAQRNITTLNPFETLNLNTYISIQSLPYGLNTLHIRFKDIDQLYSQTLSYYFYHDKNVSDSINKITEYEYWIDNQTNSSVINSISPSSTIFLNEIINFDSINQGLHTLHIRFKDYNYNWSQTLSKLIYKITNTLDSNNMITEYEYWFDDEYASKTLNFVTPTKTLVLDQTYNFDSLGVGLHTFNIRFKDVNQNWSSTQSKLYYKIPNTLDSNNVITKYEYWFDDKYSLKSVVSVSPATTLILDEIINFDSINRGLHTFHIRFKDNNQSWSAVLNKVFYKQITVPTLTNDIIVYRYWFNNNEFSVQYTNLATPVNPLDKVLNIEIPDSLDFGTHQITLQFKDSTGLWSVPITDDFIYTATTQNIALNTGWNIMSFYVTPDSIGMIDIVQPLADSSTLIKLVDQTGGFIQEIPGLGWINTVGDMSNAEGYYIKVNAIDTLVTEGRLVYLPYSIPLQTGWNMMGYPIQTSQSAITALQTLINNSNLIKVVNEEGGIIQNIPGVGWLNTIGNFDADEGYYIKVASNDTLVINETFVKASEQYMNLYEGDHYVRNSTGNPYLPMHIVATFDNDIVLFEGDEFGVFINDICIGSSYIINTDSPFVTYLTTDDPTTEIIDGGRQGDIMSFRLLHLGKEYELICQNQDLDDILYLPLETKFLTFSTNALGTSESEVNGFYVSEIMPNPMADKARIYVNIPEAGSLRIELLDLRGVVMEHLFEGEVDARNMEVQIDGNNLNSGMYFIQVNYNNGEKMERVLRKVVVKASR